MCLGMRNGRFQDESILHMKENVYGRNENREVQEMEYVMTAESLCKHYGHFKALDGLSMHVPKGAVYGFVGKNGAGKTTLLRLI